MGRKEKELLKPEAFVGSVVYYDKENLDDFLKTFSSLEIKDANFSHFLAALQKASLYGALDDLPEDPSKRKDVITSILTNHFESIPSTVEREKAKSWLSNALKNSSYIQLTDELMDRYIWEDYYSKVKQIDDDDSIPFSQKLDVRPVIPPREKKLFKSLDELIENIDSEEVKLGSLCPTGISNLDDIVQMKTSNFVIVAARPSVGKSLFMLNHAIALAADGVPIIYSSFEEKDMEIAHRIKSNIESHRDSMSADEFQSYYSNVVNNITIFSPDTSSPDFVFTQIAEEIKNKDAKGVRVKAVFVDYAQLIKAPGMNEFESLRETTREMKLFANRYDVLLETASQLKRDTEYTGAGLSGLFGSSTLEADANIVLLLDPVRKGIRKGDKEKVNIKIAKNRGGQQGEVKVFIDYSNGTILDI